MNSSISLNFLCSSASFDVMMTMAPGMDGARWYHHQVDSRYPPPPHHPHGPHQHPGMHDPASIINPDHQVKAYHNYLVAA